MTRQNRAKKTGLVMAAGLGLSLLMSVFGGMGALSRVYAADDFANEAFQAAWEQLDGAVAGGQVARPYLWGTPGTVLNEDYKESKSGKRQVQYFAKGRMELTRPDTLPDFVGDGRLVLEMVTGRVQIGDNAYLQFDGCECPVAGATRFAANPGAPSYRAFQSVLRARPSLVGLPVNLVLPAPEDEGFFLGFKSLNVDNALGTLAKNAVYVMESGHNVPDIFWDFLNQPDPNGLPLFNWQTLFGLPLTDAYWVKVRGEDGSPQDTLVQLFERRTLLYNPAASGFQVESGNVGNDYYGWRYRLPELPVYEDRVEPSSGFGLAAPSVGEAGTTFILSGYGFKPNEKVSAWLEQQRTSSGPTVGRGIFEFPVEIDSQGRFRVVRRTRPLLSASRQERLVVLGNESRNKVVLNFRVVSSTRYTPAVEAVQPGDVPANVSATLDDKIIKVGGSSKLVAKGFTPGEALGVWLTTPLNRVISWRAVIFSSAVFVGTSKQIADKDGEWKTDVPGPGVPLPGIYALTIYGKQSGKTAYVYFRTRTGTVLYYNPTWGYPDAQGPQAASPLKIDLSNLPLDPALQTDPMDLQTLGKDTDAE